MSIKKPYPPLAETTRNEIWVTDITYIPTDEGWLYAAALLDLYSRKVVGWASSASLETELCHAALRMALQHRRPAQGLLHHSDRGSQYASHRYRTALHSHGMTQSMSRKANCYDNAVMESFWSTLKYELVSRCHYQSRAEARLSITHYIETFYNRVRLHSALGFQSPVDFENLLN